MYTSIHYPKASKLKLIIFKEHFHQKMVMVVRIQQWIENAKRKLVLKMLSCS